MPAVDTAEELKAVSKTCAFDYRDGLIITLLAVIPLRRRTLTALRLKVHLIRSGNLWALDIPAVDMKVAEPVEFLLSAELSARIDLYLEKFRDGIPGAERHDGLWPSNKGGLMDDGSIYDAVRRRTRKAFGFAVNLHSFRHAALTFWPCSSATAKASFALSWERAIRRQREKRSNPFLGNPIGDKLTNKTKHH